MSQTAADAERDRIVCACFGVTAGTIRDHLKKPGATLAGLAEETRIGTKCTACLLDLDVELERLKAKGGTTERIGADSDQEAPARGPIGLSARREIVDSGFLENREGRRTVLRIDNAVNPFNKRSESALVDYRWTLRLLDESGRMTVERTGALALGEGLTLDVSTVRGCPEAGWFWIWMSPLQRGYFGATRPQFMILGAGARQGEAGALPAEWAATVHTQPHATACRLKSVLLRRDRGRFGAYVSAVNGVARAPAEVTLALSGLTCDDMAERGAAVPPNGSKMLDLDVLYENADLADGVYMLDVKSDVPIRKHIVLPQPSGAWSIDHFPNLK